MDRSTEFVKQELTGSDEITQHFFLYIIHLKRAMDTAGQHVDKKLVQVWIGKILETPHPDVRLAMKRNMYLAQLILYLYDGKLKAPFTSVPADGPLATYDELPFYGGAPDGQRAGGTVAPETANRELPLDELNHVSSDGRTYVAVQSLCDGATLFGYVAVTIGHAGSLWLNSRGETIKAPTPKLKDLHVKTTVTQGIQFDTDDQTNNGLKSLANEVWKVLSRRNPLKIRERAGDLYRMLYNAIEQEMLSYKNDLHSSQCSDPYVGKLLDFLVKDLMVVGIRDPKAFCRQNLLSALKKRTKAIINEIENRQGIFEEFKKSSQMPMMQLLLRPASNCPSFISVMTLQEALEGTMNRKTMDLLSVQYPSCVVNQFKKLVIDEKVRTMHMAKARLDNITGEMFNDLKKSILQGLRGYQKARLEWARAWSVLKEYDEVSKLVSKLTVTAGGGNNENKLVEIIEIEIELAHKQLENAKRRTEKMEKEIETLHQNIHEMSDNYEAQKLYAKQQEDILKTEIINEELAMQQRVATLEHLKSMK